VDWKEIQMTWNVEEPPRYAQLLTAESHLTEINRDLTEEAIAKGFKLIRSRQVAQQTVIAFVDCISSPRTRPEALQRIRSITADSTRSAVDQQKGAAGHEQGHQPRRNSQSDVQGPGDADLRGRLLSRPAGLGPYLEKRFPEMYGYDPKKPNNCWPRPDTPRAQGKGVVVSVAGAPELVQVMEAVATQLREVGIELELERPTCRGGPTEVRERRANGYLRGGVPSKKAVEPQIALFNAGKGVGHWFEDDTIYGCGKSCYRCPIRRHTLPAAKDRQLQVRELRVIPLSTHIEVVVNPRIINDWPFSGWTAGTSATRFSSVRVSRRSLVSRHRREPAVRALRARATMDDEG